MIKVAYLTVSPADCPEDPGLLLADCSRLLCFKRQIHKLSIWWAAESYLCLCPPSSIRSLADLGGRDAPLLLVWPLLIGSQQDPDLVKQTANKGPNSKQTRAHSGV